MLTAWIELVEGVDRSPTAAEFRAFLGELLPAHAIPAAFVTVSSLPMTPNGKLAQGELPAPDRTHRSGLALPVSPATELEATIVSLWERILRLEPVGTQDDFFALGGDSLDALQMVVALSAELSLYLREDLAFTHTTPHLLATAIGALVQDDGGHRDGGHKDGGHKDGGHRDGGEVDGLDGGVDASAGFGPATYEVPPASFPPLSLGEQSILFGQRTRPDGLMYNVGRVFRVEGAVDPARFEPAVREAAALHQPLSWTFEAHRRHLTAAEAVRFVASSKIIDPEDLAETVRAFQLVPFDLRAGELLRCLVQPLTDGATAVAFAIHHVSGDHSSFDRLWDQINVALRGGRLEPLVVDYARFCAWQAATDSTAHREFWIEQAPATPTNALTVAPPPVPEADGFLQRRAEVAPIELRAGSSSMPIAVTLAAVAATVRCHSERDHVDMALVASSRTHPAAQPLFGYLLNPIPLSFRCSAGTSMRELLDASTRTFGAAYPHRGYPLANIAADRRTLGLDLPRTNILVAFDDEIPTDLEGVPVTQQVTFNGTAVTDMSFFIEVRDHGIDLGLEYSGAVMSAGDAAAILATFDAALTAALRSPASTIKALTATVQSRSTSSGLSNRSGLFVGEDLVDERTVLEQIQDHFDSETIAVRCGDDTLTWRELGRSARAIAERLRKVGVGTGDSVIVGLPRSVDMVAAILGTQLAGAAYVPIDANYPEHRLRSIAHAVRAHVAITTADRAWLAAVTIDPRDSHWNDTTGSAGSASDLTKPNATDPAYVIFTSGSTGVPRGVAVSHGQLSASTNARRQMYMERPTRFGMVSGIGFDSSVVGLFWTMAEGGEVVIPRENEAHDVDALVRFMTAQPMSHFLCVPTLYQGLLRRRPTASTHLWPDRIIVAGEACPPALVDAHFKAVPLSGLTNEYGPTETTVWASAHHCEPGEDPVPIGQPIPGAWLALVDESGVFCEPGNPGTLIIGGRGVTAGYIDAADLNEAKFGSLLDDAVLPDLTPPDRTELITGFGDHFFRTGDRAMEANGTIIFLGRDDDQMNFGGMRIEPGEIEALLNAAPSVDAAVVVAADIRTLPDLLGSLPQDVIAEAMSEASTSDDPSATLRSLLLNHGTPDLRMIAHVETPALDLTALDAAVQTLPVTSRPSEYVAHTLLPRTPNGKLDRQQVAALVQDQTVGETLAAPTKDDAASGPSAIGVADAEERITTLFRDILRDPSIIATDSLFDKGGHSLLVVEVVLALEETFDVAVPTTTIYEAQSPRELARLLGSVGAAPDVSMPRGLVIPLQSAGSGSPIFAIHNLGENCRHFRPLAEALGTDRPLYGLGPSHDVGIYGYEGHDVDRPTEVSQIASTYVDEIVRIAPDGPIVIAGLCAGAVVAYDVILQLQQQGRHVELFAMVNDWHAPGLHLHESASFREKLELRRSHFRTLGGAYISSISRLPFLATRRRMEIAGLDIFEKLHLRLPKTLQLRKVIEQYALSIYHYQCAPLDVRTIIYRGDADPRYQSADFSDGWEGVLENYEVVIARGVGASVLAEPGVHEIAASMNAALGSAAHIAGGAAELSLANAEERLIEGLLTGHLTSAVHELAHASGDVKKMADRVTATIEELAEQSRVIADEVARYLSDEGLATTAAPTPRRMTHNLAVVFVEGDPADSVPLLTRHGYFLGHPLGRHYDEHGEKLMFHRTDARSSARVRVVAASATRSAASENAASWHDPTMALGGYLATPKRLIEPLLRFADADPEELVVDLGCGDGRVLIAAVEDFECRGRGIELDPELVKIARANVASAGLDDRIEILEGDALTADLADAAVVFAFVPPTSAPALVKNVLDRLNPGARLIVHEQVAVDWPVAADKRRLLLAEAEAEGDTPSGSGITVGYLWSGRGN